MELAVRINKFENNGGGVVAFLEEHGIKILNVSGADPFIKVKFVNDVCADLESAEWINAVGLTVNGLAVSYSIKKELSARYMFIPMSNIAYITCLKHPDIS